MENEKITKVVVKTIDIRQASLDSDKEEMIKRVIATEGGRRFFVENLEKHYGMNCYCISYTNSEISDSDAQAFVDRVNKRLIELRGLQHQLYLLGLPYES